MEVIIMTPEQNIYGYTIGYETKVKSREEIIRELETDIMELEKELGYKRRLLAYLLGLPQWEAM